LPRWLSDRLAPRALPSPSAHVVWDSDRSSTLLPAAAAAEVVAQTEELTLVTGDRLWELLARSIAVAEGARLVMEVSARRRGHSSW